MVSKSKSDGKATKEGFFGVAAHEQNRTNFKNEGVNLKKVGGSTAGEVIGQKQSPDNDVWGKTKTSKGVKKLSWG